MYINATQSQHKPFNSALLGNRDAGYVDFNVDTSFLARNVGFKVSKAFRKDPAGFVNSKSKYYQKILRYLRSFYKRTRILLRNHVIAAKVGCSVRTVIRVTDALMADGLVYKYKKHGWAPNDYILHPALKGGKLSFSLWFNELTPYQQIMYMDHGILVEKEKPKKVFTEKNVTHTYKLVLVNSLFKKESITVLDSDVSETKRVRAYVREGRPVTYNLTLSKQSTTKTFHNSKTKGEQAMKMNKETPNINDEAFNELQSSIISIYELCDDDKLKLFAFPASALEHAFDVEDKKRRVGKISSFKMLVNEATAWCGERGIKPDWARFYRLRKYYKTTPEKGKVERKQYQAKSTSERVHRPEDKEAYDKIASKYVKQSKQPETGQEIYREIVKFEKVLEEYENDPKTNTLKPYLIEMAKSRIQKLNEQLIEFCEADSEALYAAELQEARSIVEDPQPECYDPMTNSEDVNEICDTREPDTISQTTLLSETRVRQTETPETSSWDQPKEPTRISTLLRGYASS